MYGVKKVAPYVGAWIEIDVTRMILPSVPQVAPYVGAWIEIHIVTPFPAPVPVAPYVGAWIEISFTIRITCGLRSPLT